MVDQVGPSRAHGLGFVEVHDLLAGSVAAIPDRAQNCQPSLSELVHDAWKDSIRHVKHDRQPQTILSAFARAWDIAARQLAPWDIHDATVVRIQDPAVIRAAFDCIAGIDMAASLLDYYEEVLVAQIPLLERHVDAHIRLWQNDGDVSHIQLMIEQLCVWYLKWHPQKEFGPAFSNVFRRSFTANLHVALPPAFQDAFVSIVRTALNGGGQGDLFAQLETLGVLEHFESLKSSVICTLIEERIQETCPGQWSVPQLVELRQWLAATVVPAAITHSTRGGSPSHSQGQQSRLLCDRFDLHLRKSLGDLRTSEIFDIIVDYPDSSPALNDLKECIQHLDQRAQLVTSLRKLNKRRLLHPGADTKDILSQYVATIRCLRIIDPAGVLLHKVADPIRRYLRHRPDTIRTIVAGLVGEGSDLIDDSEPVVPINVLAEDYSDPNWEPEPLDAGPHFRTNKPSDVISTLVSIYDSKDLFVKELQILLAERLLSINDGNYDREVRNIEILKLRFGETALHVCEIMLKDMTDSKRIDQRIHQEHESTLHASIVSKHFWPPLNASNIKMPKDLQNILTAYEKHYTVQKSDKRLLWIPQIGTVTLHLELKDRDLEVKVNPLEAAIIELFGEKEIWTLNELAEALGTEGAVARKALTRWLDLRVVNEDKPHTYRLLEEREEVADGVASRDVEMGPAASVSTQQQQAEQVRVFWRFIQGMLTNVGAMPLGRIQGMLKFAPGYDRTLDQLRVFMDSARREGLVDVKDGVWKLVK
ncbi:hypothetical protein BKA62DRAFT_690199 [Auriculariales sp. MPI-PUGE-AT-0066]|nr:hypothetical protein BKA62DRAFT_690199 [Auriculariales sp. MPI-PUGE-AT-0066]